MTEGRDVPYGPEDDGEREAAVNAAQQIIEGPTIRVPRSTWLAVMALMREAVRTLEVALDETSTQQADDDWAAE